MPPWLSHLVLDSPPSHLLHSLRVPALQLGCREQRADHLPRIFASAVAKNLAFIFVPCLPAKRVLGEDVAPHPRRNGAVKEIRVVGRRVTYKMPKVRLKRCTRDMRDEPARVVQSRQFSRGIEGRVKDCRGVVHLVQGGEEDLRVGVDGMARVLVVVTGLSANGSALRVEE